MSRPKIDARPTRVSDVLRSWDVLPVADLEMLFGAGPPLVLAPHPDDESIGCGGIIAGCCAQGPPPTVVVVTDGAASHPGSRRWPPEALRDLRESEAREAVRRLGLPGDRIRFLRLADAAAPHGGEAFDGAVDEVCRVVMSSRCGAVLATWSHDPHCDHKAVAKMARAVACRTGVPHYAYPVWGWTLPADQVLPIVQSGGWRVPTGPHLAAKRAAIAAHRSQTTDMIADAATPWHLADDFLRRFDQPFELLLHDG